MWFSIFAVAGFILFSFLKGVRNIKKEVSQAGGMRVKYAILIKLLLEGDSRTKIYNETSTSIILGLVVMGGYSRFEIQQAFGVIVVKWISVVGSKEYRVFGTLRCRTFGINAVEELALTNTEFVSKVDQIFLRFEESLPVLQAVTITG